MRNAGRLSEQVELTVFDTSTSQMWTGELSVLALSLCLSGAVHCGWDVRAMAEHGPSEYMVWMTSPTQSMFDLTRTLTSIFQDLGLTSRP